MDEDSFPRGFAPPAVVKAKKMEENGEVEKKTKKRRDRASGDKMEDLFNDYSEEMVAPKKKKKMKQLTDEENKELAGKGARKEKRSFEVVQLTYDTVVKDLLTLGVVDQIYDRSMIIVMPGRTTGKVEIDKVSGPFTKHLKNVLSGKDSSYHTLRDMFQLGQVVIAKVMDVGALENGRGHHSVQLSLDPKDVHGNWSAKVIQQGMNLVGAVKSREDNGWQIDFGIKGVVAFLPEQEAKLHNKTVDLLIGQLVNVKVTKVSGNGRALQVSMQLDKKPKTQNDLHPGGINYSLLLPGMTLQSFVEDVNETGLKLNAENTTALCHVDHLSEEWANPQASYAPPKDLTVKVLYLHPNLTVPYVTTRQDLIPIRTTLKYGKADGLVEEMVKVQVASTSNRGVLVRVGEEKKKGLLPVSSLGEGLFTCKEDIDKKFKRKNEIECRVMKYSPFENMYLCTLKKQLLETKYLRESKVPSGTVVRCTVTKVTDGGVEVNFESNLKGFVPRAFVNEDTFQLLLRKQKAWEKQRQARVIEFDSDKNRLVLTLKKELVKSKGKVIRSLEEAQVGHIGDGIVLRVDSTGVVVKTIGGVKGYIPTRNFLALDFYKKVEFAEHLSTGSLIKYQVVRIEKDRDQLLLKPTEEEPEEGVPRKAEPENGVKEKEEGQGVKRKRKDSSSDTNQKLEGVVSSLGSKKQIRKRRKKKNKNKDKNEKEEEEVEVKSEDEEEEEVVKEEVKTESEDMEVVEDIKPEELELKIELGDFWGEDKVEEEPKEEARITPTEKKDKKGKKQKEKPVVEAPTTPVQPKSGLNLTPSPVKKWVEAYEKGSYTKVEESKEAGFWIRLMEHYQESMQYEQVRKVGRDGLDYTPIAQQADLREAMKIWRRLFVFELEFGKDGDSEKILKEAIERTDKKYECLRMAAQAYEKLGKHKVAEKLYRDRITKECGTQVDGWINFAKLYLEGTEKNPEMARNVFHQAVQTKQAQSQPNFITDITYRFATLELYHGDKEKAKEMFHTVLAQLPKRIDIWMVYVQALIKMELYDRARSIFQEFFAMSWKPNKIKGMLTLYRKFETEHGTPESKEAMKEVMEKALNLLTASTPAEMA